MLRTYWQLEWQIPILVVKRAAKHRTAKHCHEESAIDRDAKSCRDV